MAIFEVSSISKKLKRFRTFEWYFRKQLTIEVITEQNMKKSEISRLSSHSRFLQKLALNSCNINEPINLAKIATALVNNPT